MSVGLFLRCAVLGFAVVVAATVAILSGPLASGLSFVTFLLGVVASELYHTRASPVETSASRAEDSAFMALFEAQPAADPVAAEAAAPEGPPAPPKRNFRCTSDALAIGSTIERTQLIARHAQHRSGLRRTPAPTADTPAPSADEALFEPAPESPTAPDPVELGGTVQAAEADEAPTPAPALDRTLNRDPPPPKVTIFRAA